MDGIRMDRSMLVVMPLYGLNDEVRIDPPDVLLLS